MASLISNLTSAEQRDLLADLNYLNMGEIKQICKRHKIPYWIVLETGEGKRRKTSDLDRKGVVLKRIRQFLESGVIPKETCFSAEVVRMGSFPKKVAADDRLLYGQYQKKNRSMMALLRELTEGEFKNGAIARILAREFWTAGRAPTFREFAAEWQKARREHESPNPEWAFLTDRSNKTADADWKKLRIKKAKKVMDTLNIVFERSRRGG